MCVCVSVCFLSFNEQLVAALKEEKANFKNTAQRFCFRLHFLFFFLFREWKCRIPNDDEAKTSKSLMNIKWLWHRKRKRESVGAKKSNRPKISTFPPMALSLFIFCAKPKKKSEERKYTKKKWVGCFCARGFLLPYHFNSIFAPLHSATQFVICCDCWAMLA